MAFVFYKVPNEALIYSFCDYKKSPRTNDFYVVANRWWQSLSRIMQLTLSYSRR